VVVLGLFFLLRGHDAPGGGFIAGLTLGTGVILRWLAFGPRGVGRLMQVAPLTLIAAGLVLAIATGAVTTLLGEPFLSVALWTGEVVGLSFKVSSSLVFDVGVTSLVLGTVGALVRAMGEIE
jgi:multisubunit Na+/H+ antiporter MnhB subunit